MPTVPERPIADGPETISRDGRALGFTSKAAACYRCHARKVKCSGGHPCQNCRQAEKGIDCSYPQRTRQVKVTQRFIESLYEEIEQLKRQNNRVTQPNTGATTSGSRQEAAQPPDPAADEDHEDPLLNSTLNDKPWFDNVNVFCTPILIGEAADAAFATRFRQVISDPKTPEPSHLLRLNYATNESLMNLAVSGMEWPSPSRAKFLIEAALKYIGRSYYIVRRSSVIENLSRGFHDSNWDSSLLRYKFWALFAIGELYSTRSITGHELPGMAYFSQASKMLGILDERPGTDSIEVLLLLSFYSLALNRRYSAYILSGTAMRSAIVMGLHLNIPETQLSDPGIREHRKRLFWTAYIFDRVWASKLGHPSAIQDEEIQVYLPSEPSTNDPANKDFSSDFADTAYHVASLKLASLLTKVIRSVYNLYKPDQGPNLSARVRQALKDLQTWVESLPPHLKIDQSLGETQGFMAASLHLSFNQCVILATRPVLLHILRAQVAASSSPSNPTSAGIQISASASALSEACIRCARHSFRLLRQAWIEGFFVTYDCIFTQHLFSSLTILAISSLLGGKDNRDDGDNFGEASRLLTQLKDAGNCVAQEYCHHVDLMKTALTTHVKISLSTVLNMPEASSAADLITHPGQASSAPPETVGMALEEPSLQELLTQPVDLQFLEDAVQDDFPQGLYWPDLSTER